MDTYSIPKLQQNINRINYTMKQKKGLRFLPFPNPRNETKRARERGGGGEQSAAHDGCGGGRMAGWAHALRLEEVPGTREGKI